MLNTKIFKEFFASERACGFVLVAVTIVSLILANTQFGETLIHSFHQKYFGLSIEHWVNDGLMALFFLLIGLELEREIYVGELSSWKNAILPIVAAIGGILVPASIHFAFNHGTVTQSGAGIPMATDIAFSLGVLSLFGTKVPYSLKIFLTALAIADDLGAILVIAAFYTKELSYSYLSCSLVIFAILVGLNRMRVYRLAPYLIGGVAMWWCMLHSGIHATISGVLLAFAIPFSPKPEECVSHSLQHRLHYPVAFGVLPVFALVNTCIPIESDWYRAIIEPNSIGIFLGLVIGKPLGILLFCWFAITLKFAQLSEGLHWKHLVGAGCLAGIGFTMSIFVSLLAFEDHELINMSQIMVLIASVTSAALGACWFTWFVSASPAEERVTPP